MTTARDTNHNRRGVSYAKHCNCVGPHWSELGGVGELHWFRVKHFLPWPWPCLVSPTVALSDRSFEGGMSISHDC
jgi:hypothetical protein